MIRASPRDRSTTRQNSDRPYLGRRENMVAVAENRAHWWECITADRKQCRNDPWRGRFGRFRQELAHPVDRTQHYANELVQILLSHQVLGVMAHLHISTHSWPLIKNCSAAVLG